MCANFISRMGISKIGYLQKDPMQKDALDAAAKMLSLDIYRPGNTDLQNTMEAAFKTSGFPEDEITTWLGDESCRSILAGLCEKYPVNPESMEGQFLEKRGIHYPGCIDLAFDVSEPETTKQSAPGIEKAGDSAPGTDDDAASLQAMMRSTSALLLDDVETDDSDDDEVDAEDVV